MVAYINTLGITATSFCTCMCLISMRTLELLMVPSSIDKETFPPISYKVSLWRASREFDFDSFCFFFLVIKVNYVTIHFKLNDMTFNIDP